MTHDVYSFEDYSGGRKPARRTSARSRRSGIAKRSVDLIGAASGLLLLLPLLLLLALAIKASSRGPVLFRQKRHGLNGKTFTIYKFRTMYVEQSDLTGIQQTIAGDPRITPIGHFLRRSNFDELPQLLNVLYGEMSLVGPRPHVPGMLACGVPYEVFDPRYQIRHQVKPGLTGLAQVNGFRGETKDAHSARMRLNHDLDYIRRRSLSLDLSILFKTVLREFFSGNGY